MQTKLSRSTTDRMLAGVCGGLARYFNIDPVIVRILFVIAVLSGASPIIYIILWIVMPEDNSIMVATSPPSQNPTGEWKFDPYTGERIEQ